MIIGVISDTHDNLTAISRAVGLFNDRNVGHVLHAGDYTSPFTFRALRQLSCPFTGIFGNNDGDRLLLQEMSGNALFNQPHIFELQGKRIIMMHEHHIIDALADSGHYDLIIYGHTHEAALRKAGNALVLNPGEAGSWLYGRATAALVDLTSLTAEIIELS